MTWKATGSHQNRFSSEKTSVVDGRGQDSPLLAADPMEGWTERNSVPAKEKVRANQTGDDSLPQVPPTNFPEFLQCPLPEA